MNFFCFPNLKNRTSTFITDKHIFSTRISGCYAPFILAPAEGCVVGLQPTDIIFH